MPVSSESVNRNDAGLIVSAVYPKKYLDGVYSMSISAGDGSVSTRRKSPVFSTNSSCSKIISPECR